MGNSQLHIYISFGGGGTNRYSTSHEDNILSEVTDSLTKVVFDLDTPANIGKQLD